MARYRIPLIVIGLVFSVVACSILPTGLIPQLSSETQPATAQPPSQTTIFPTQPPPAQANATEAPTTQPIEPQPVPTQAPILPQPGAQPQPQPAAQTQGAERIKFPAGDSSGMGSGRLPANGIKQLVIGGTAGQTLSVQLLVVSGQPALAVWGADGTVLISDHAGATEWSGALPSTQDYYIGISNQGSGATSYTIQVSLPGASRPEQPAVPVTVPPATGGIPFAPFNSTTTVYGKASFGPSNTYVVKGTAGQTLSVSLNCLRGQATLNITSNSTTIFSENGNAPKWSGQLPASNDYIIEVTRVGAATNDELPYTLKVSLQFVGK